MKHFYIRDMALCTVLNNRVLADIHRRGGLGLRVDLQHSCLCSGFKSGEWWREGMNTWVSLDSVLCQVYFFSLSLSLNWAWVWALVSAGRLECVWHTLDTWWEYLRRESSLSFQAFFSGRLWRAVGQVYGLREQKRSSRYMNAHMRVINKKSKLSMTELNHSAEEMVSECVFLLLACIHGCVWVCTPLLRGTGHTVHCCGATEAEHLWLKWVNNVCSHPQQTW